MLTLAIFYAFVSAAVPVLSAPTASLDPAVFRQNALDAQILNAEFQTLKSTDPCDSGQIACVDDSLALCSSGSWQLQACRASEHCLALPSITSAGTNLDCSSEAHALSLMKAAGVDGGLVATNPNSTVAFPTAPPATVVSTPSGAASSSSSVRTVTVTVTRSAASTLPTETITMNQAEAASVLASLSSEGFIATPVAVATSTSTDSVPSATSSPSGTTDPECMSTTPASTSQAGPEATSAPGGSPYRRRSLFRRW